MRCIGTTICALVLGATLTMSSAGSVSAADRAAIPGVSVQLWSVRDVIASDFGGTLRQLAAMGFDAVELAGNFGPYADDPKGLVRFLDSLGLRVSGAHIVLDQLGPENFERTATFYQAIACPMVIVTLDQRAWDPDRVGQLVADLIDLSKRLEVYGLQLGYHNHPFEFLKYGEWTYWDYIARTTPKNFILQLDVGWARYAGVDPVAYIRRYPGRTRSIHIKAKLPPPEPMHEPPADPIAALMNIMAEGQVLAKATGKLPLIGQDGTDWPAVIQASLESGGTRWFVLEQEEYPNGMTSMEALQASKTAWDGFFAAHASGSTGASPP